jgi:cyclopropane-fatty-acyl-phospholipid synthase
MTATAQLAINWVEQGLVPDLVIRSAIRRLCKSRLCELPTTDCEQAADLMDGFISDMGQSPVALLPDQANEQHYEVPAAFFDQVLGPRRKYSCSWWPEGAKNLAEAENASLDLTCKRAGLIDGQSVLELGCGWGSLTLWMAEHYPGSRIMAVSNSQSQRQHIESRAAELGFTNIKVVTADMNDFDTAERFDSVVSVEMFEHMRNWRSLFLRIHGWLRPGGRFLMHIFCHRDTPYLFEDRGADDWMSRHFFSGGMMPSDSLPLHFQDHLKLIKQWRWSGMHYQKTSNAWLENMDNRRAVILPILAETYGIDSAEIWWQRWRIFFMACAETFGYDNGHTWWVSHYLFERP